MAPRPRVTVGLVLGDDPRAARVGAPSVLAQRPHLDVRLAVVDGGPAGSLDALAGDPRVEVVDADPSRGLAHARNRILEAAGTDRIGWIDAVTVWRPHHLAALLDALDAPGPHPTSERIAVAACRGVDAARAGGATPDRELGGDQLRGLLAGELRPPLPAVLAPAPLLREAGGFDERLGHEHGRELLLRAVAGGARLVGAPGGEPSCTRLGHDGTSSAGELARDLRTVRRAHRGDYARYGPGFARACRADDLRAVAGAHDQDGRTGRATATRWWATAAARLDPGTPRRVAGRARRAVRRRLADPPTARTTPGRGPEPTAASDDTRADAGAGRPGPPPDRDADTPERWLRREAALREADDLPAAQDALEEGLEHHPGDGALLGRLVELLVLRRDWRGCAAAWAAVPPGAEEQLTALVYTRAASAHRMLGDHRGALAIAATGSRRWPRSHEVQRELYRARAALVDWGSCLHAPPTWHDAATSEDPVGVVTGLGVLGGQDGGVTGWLHAADEGAVAVTLLVNDEPVVTTFAAGGPQRPRARFAIDCQDLIEYLGDGDVLSVRGDGRPLEIEGLGPRGVVMTGYPSRVGVLRKRLRSGWVFAKLGRLRRRYTAADVADLVAFLRELSAVVERRTQQVTYPLYGNLLGTIRDHGIIPHDVGGFDLGYVSTHHSPRAVRAEFLEVCRDLLAAGYHLTLTPWCAMVRRRSTDARFLDLNFAWFTPEGGLQLSYGWRHAPATGPERLRAARQCPLAGHLVPVPGDAEAVLEQIYGPGWTVPDQGFDLDVGLQRDARFLLTGAELASLRGHRPDRVRIESAPEEDDGQAADRQGPQPR